MGLTVLWVAGIFFVISAVSYTVTKAGLRVPSWAVLEDADEVLLGMTCLFLSGLAVVAGATLTVAAAAGAPRPFGWAAAALATVVVGVPAGRSALRRLPTEVLVVQRRRDLRDGVEISRTLGPGKHQR